MQIIESSSRAVHPLPSQVVEIPNEAGESVSTCRLHHWAFLLNRLLSPSSVSVHRRTTKRTYSVDKCSQSAITSNNHNLTSTRYVRTIRSVFTRGLASCDTFVLLHGGLAAAPTYCIFLPTLRLNHQLFYCKRRERRRNVTFRFSLNTNDLTGMTRNGTWIRSSSDIVCLLENALFLDGTQMDSEMFGLFYYYYFWVVAKYSIFNAACLWSVFERSSRSRHDARVAMKSSNLNILIIVANCFVRCSTSFLWEHIAPNFGCNAPPPEKN